MPPTIPIPLKVSRNFFLRVRDDRTDLVLQSLASGLEDPMAQHPLNFQNLMSFAAARKRHPDSNESNGSLEIAERLVQLGVPTNFVDRNGQTALFYAAREGNIECCMFLMSSGCDINHLDINTESAVFYSLREGRFDVSEMFIARGARMDIVDKFGKRAQDYAPKTKGKRMFATSMAVASNDTNEIPAVARNAEAKQPLPAPAPAPSNDPPRKRLRKSPPTIAPTIEDSKTDGEKEVVKAHKLGAKGQKEAMKVSSFEDDLNILARAGEFVVCEPRVEDCVPLRELELEFVADHASLFAHEEWHARHRHADWCNLVNVIQNESEARGAIQNIVMGHAPDHSTLKCVYEPTGQIIGYLHTTRSGSDLDVSHLKVHRAHQGRGLGGLLLAGAIRFATRQCYQVECLRLVVLHRNSRAMNLYFSLGFEEVKSMQKKMPHGPQVAWRRMERQVEEALTALAAVWEARVEDRLNEARMRT